MKERNFIPRELVDDVTSFFDFTGRWPSETLNDEFQPLGIHWLWWIHPEAYEITYGKKLPELPEEWKRKETTR